MTHALNQITPPIYTGELPTEKVDMFDVLQDAVMDVAEGKKSVAGLYNDGRFKQRVFTEIEGINSNLRVFQFTGTNGFCCLVAYELDDKQQIRVHCNELNDVLIAMDGQPPHLLNCFDRGFTRHPKPNNFAEPVLLEPAAADTYFENALKRLGPTRPMTFVRGGTSIAIDVK
ncbi:MAG: hypothetical protein SFW65_04940 [Alphaproteobacteria bacterium]|nr:hypothetical protein [Alphaproteobacteria bacterium]